MFNSTTNTTYSMMNPEPQELNTPFGGLTIRDDPSVLQGPQRLSSATRDVRRSERGYDDNIVIHRGGNNGSGEKSSYRGYDCDIFSGDNQATIDSLPQVQPPQLRGIPQHSHGGGYSEHSHGVSAPHHHQMYPHPHHRYETPPPPTSPTRPDFCPHYPQCRYFKTFGFWCQLHPEEKRAIKSIRM